MFFKIMAAAAIMAVPAVAHAQGTTPAVPQDTTHTRIHTDSTKVDTSNGSIYTKKKTTVTDTTKSSTNSHRLHDERHAARHDAPARRSTEQAAAALMQPE